MSSPAILLTAVNARYSHTAFGLRYLMANMGELEPVTAMQEFDLKRSPVDIAESVLAAAPRIAGFGVYIWNAGIVFQVIEIVKQVRPDIIIVIGGPEVSHEIDRQPGCGHADYIITGEADETFPQLCRDLLNGTAPAHRIIPSPPPDTTRLHLPYPLYSAEDVLHRVIYVEASRGCPFTCEFCLSSLDKHLNRFPLEDLLPAFDNLLQRGVKEFKFVDRTFNLSIPFSLQILEFFLRRHRDGMFLHFEMIPDRLPPELREILACFPRGSLQFEVGIQTFNQDVADRISRRQDYEQTLENIQWLLTETGAHIHADLIVGLPGETLESFAAGFDRLVSIGPQEIQVNLLKRLRGTPIIRHEQPFGLIFRSEPPYEIIRTSTLSFTDLQRLRRFARFWDLYANSGNFGSSVSCLLASGPSAFHTFLSFSESVYRHEQRTHSIALDQLTAHLDRYLTGELGLDPEESANLLAADYIQAGRRDLPQFLRDRVDAEQLHQPGRPPLPGRMKRQIRHLSA